MQWTEKQQQVIDSRDRNLLVSAAAGSGKTAVLVERIISLVTDSSHPVDVDQLGRTAVKKILKYMEHPEKKGGEVIRIPGKIVYRNSVREIGWKSF